MQACWYILLLFFAGSVGCGVLEEEAPLLASLRLEELEVSRVPCYYLETQDPNYLCNGVLLRVQILTRVSPYCGVHCPCRMLFPPSIKLLRSAGGSCTLQGLECGGVLLHVLMKLQQGLQPRLE